jgi:hypothetical protein
VRLFGDDGFFRTLFPLLSCRFSAKTDAAMPTKLASRQSGILLAAWRASAILGFGVAVPWAFFRAKNKA